MNEKSAPDDAQALALQRFTLVSKVQDLVHQRLPLRTALAMVSRVPIQGPDGLEFVVALRTLEDWWYAFRHGGFPALHPKSRSDRGLPRALTPEQQQRILAAVRSQPGIAVKVLYRLWRTEDPTLPAISSVYRCLRAHDLDRRSRHRQLHQAVSGPTKAFEAPAVNELWMADFSPGPYLPADGNATTPRGTHLCAIIDDHSRLVVAALYHPDATTRSFHATLKEALRRRGLPRKLYTDQGGPFVNDHTRLVCANLNIRLLHAKPYHAWSKGKIERFFRTVQEDFEALQRRPGHGPATLDELNGRLADWLQSVYHVRVHQGTDQPPQTRFQNASHQIRSLDATLDLDRLFFSRVNRTVRKDGTLRLDCHLYEVDPALRGLEVQLCFDPWTLARVEVSYRGQSFGLARPVNLHLNSQISGNTNHVER